MLSKVLVVAFCCLFFFAMIMSYMPSEFRNPTRYNSKSLGSSFDASDILAWNASANSNMTFPYENITDIGLPGGQRLSIQWQDSMVGRIFHLKHLTDNLWGLWWGQHEMIPYFANGTDIHWRAGTTEGHYYVTKDDIIADWDSASQYSKFSFKCPEGAITVTLLLRPTNISLTIGQAWDDGHISYIYGYTIDWSKTGVSAWSIVAQLLTLQGMDLGIPGDGGKMLNLLLWAPFMVMGVYLAYKITTGVIPWMSGGSGD